MTSLITTSAAGPWDWAAAHRLCLRETERILGSGAVAEDAAQEAVIRVWRRRGTCQRPEQPEPWMARIARREAFRLAVRASAHPHLPESAIATDRTDEALLSLTVRQAMAQLSQEERGLLYARYWRDLPQEEIARRLALPEGTVKVRLHRLRNRLRRVLEER